MKTSSLFALCCAAFMSSCAYMPAFANDTSLYAEALPADASYVRFVGYNDQSTAEFSGFTFDLNEENWDKYIPISASLLDEASHGTFTTVMRGPDGSKQNIVEGTRTRQSKVTLLLLNGTDTPLELRLADGSVGVIEQVAPAASGQREVNPVAIAFGVFAKGQPVPLATFETALRRGQNISFVVDDTGVRLIENAFAALAK